MTVCSSSGEARAAFYPQRVSVRLIRVRGSDPWAGLLRSGWYALVFVAGYTSSRT
jgi:hypothetical protein